MTDIKTYKYIVDEKGIASHESSNIIYVIYKICKIHKIYIMF